MSFFGYDTNPEGVMTPWQMAVGDVAPAKFLVLVSQGNDPAVYKLSRPPPDYGEVKLVPEPQEGPVEYKLHLLLKPRRAYRYAGSQTKSIADPRFLQSARVIGASTADQTRQDRCQHLTTQLLWRLRQSSPRHASAARQDVPLAHLPEDSAMLVGMPLNIAKLAPGLEESQGALYEIGVADDGTLVGITKSEMDQSIATLQWMAANLGCVTLRTRLIEVGECEWADEAAPRDGESSSASGAPPGQKESLFVAEIFVQPAMITEDQEEQCSSMEPGSYTPPTSAWSDQLRVTLTGPTGSGKSTLLGTLLTGAFDDGHGKGRLNSLKHRHEMASGMTSTVTQELVGYTSHAIVNYANPNIESWLGIHDFAKGGRLVFISDSAGHPRFRRTTLRGLVGWAPHWTLLCLSPFVDEASASQDTLDNTASLAKAHLDLCLKLGLPLVIVLTKSDLVTKESLRRMLGPIWAAVKSAGRTPRLLQSKQKPTERASSICDADVAMIRDALSYVQASGDFCATVPAILQSSVTGDGVGLIHALLRELPLPPKPVAHDYLGTVINQEQPATLFHIEDRFNPPTSYATSGLPWQTDVECVVSGYLRFGRLAVGQKVTVGPFPADEGAAEAGLDDEHTASPSHSSLPLSHASPHASSSGLARLATNNAVSASSPKGEWRRARIVSIRNLRLPVDTLEADQVGTLGLAPDIQVNEVDLLHRPLKPRRGMVVAVPNKHMIDNNLELQAASVLTAYFSDAAVGRLSAGTLVTFYAASVRAQAKVARVWSSPPMPTVVGAHDGKAGPAGHMEDDVFGLDPVSDEVSNSSEQGYCVRLELLFGREWVELGSKIAILEGASREGAVLDGFVGKVVRIATA